MKTTTRRYSRRWAGSGSWVPTSRGMGARVCQTVAAGLITRAVERVDSGYRSAMSVQSSLVMTGIYEFGTPEQKEKYLPAMAEGTLLGAFGLTEPDHGSDPASMETRATPGKPGYYSLSGSKTWITNSPIADVFLVWAKLEETGKIHGFIIDRAECPEGTITTPSIKDKTGLRASITGMIQLDECPVSKANMFPAISGLRGPFTCLNSARPRHRHGRRRRAGGLHRSHANLRPRAQAVCRQPPRKVPARAEENWPTRRRTRRTARWRPCRSAGSRTAAPSRAR